MTKNLLFSIILIGQETSLFPKCILSVFLS